MAASTVPTFAEAAFEPTCPVVRASPVVLVTAPAFDTRSVSDRLTDTLLSPPSFAAPVITKAVSESEMPVTALPKPLPEASPVLAVALSLLPMATT